MLILKTKIKFRQAVKIGWRLLTKFMRQVKRSVALKAKFQVWRGFLLQRKIWRKFFAQVLVFSLLIGGISFVPNSDSVFLAENLRAEVLQTQIEPQEVVTAYTTLFTEEIYQLGVLQAEQAELLAELATACEFEEAEDYCLLESTSLSVSEIELAEVLTDFEAQAELLQTDLARFDQTFGRSEEAATLVMAEAAEESFAELRANYSVLIAELTLISAIKNDFELNVERQAALVDFPATIQNYAVAFSAEVANYQTAQEVVAAYTTLFAEETYQAEVLQDEHAELLAKLTAACQLAEAEDYCLLEPESLGVSEAELAEALAALESEAELLQADLARFEQTFARSEGAAAEETLEAAEALKSAYTELIAELTLSILQLKNTLSYAVLQAQLVLQEAQALVSAELIDEINETISEFQEYNCTEELTQDPCPALKAELLSLTEELEEVRQESEAVATVLTTEIEDLNSYTSVNTNLIDSNASLSASFNSLLSEYTEILDLVWTTTKAFTSIIKNNAELTGEKVPWVNPDRDPKDIPTSDGGAPPGGSTPADNLDFATPTEPLDGPGAYAGLKTFSRFYSGNQSESALGVLAGWLNFALSLLAALAIAALVYAAFLYITAFGNNEQTEKAKKIVIWTVLGFIGLSAAFAVINTLVGGVAGPENSAYLDFGRQGLDLNWD